MDNDLERNDLTTPDGLQRDPMGRPLGDEVTTRKGGRSIERGSADIEDDDTMGVGDDLIAGESTVDPALGT